MFQVIKLFHWIFFGWVTNELGVQVRETYGQKKGVQPGESYGQRHEFIYGEHIIACWVYELPGDPFTACVLRVDEESPLTFVPLLEAQFRAMRKIEIERNKFQVRFKVTDLLPDSELGQSMASANVAELEKYMARAKVYRLPETSPEQQSEPRFEDPRPVHDCGGRWDKVRDTKVSRSEIIVNTFDRCDKCGERRNDSQVPYEGPWIRY